MRNTFIEELTAAASLNRNIILVVGDLGFGVVEGFARNFPNQFFNAGVAEQNMAGLAAGLASEGKHVFTYSIANFPTFRCAEQIRNDIDYHNLSVTTVAVGGGLAYGNLGYSHHAIQDFALMRAFPNMLIAAPGDPLEVKLAMKYLINNPQPSYLRLGKSGETILNKQAVDFEKCSINYIRKNDPDRIVLTTGTALQIAYTMMSDEKSELYSCTLASVPLWGMKNRERLVDLLKHWKEIFVFEDHLLDGGFASWILESFYVSGTTPPKVHIKSFPKEVCGLVGSQSSILEKLNFR